MSREQMLKRLNGLPHPITADLVVFDDGCEFYILTPQHGFPCMVGGAFPMIGPVRLTTGQHRDLARARSLQGDDDLKEAIEKHVRDGDRKDRLLTLLDVLGEDAVRQVLQVNWPPNRSFYVFHDMGRGESAMLPSLEAAYERFLNHFMEVDEGISWESMDEEEMALWIERLKRWRAKGSRKLPSRRWLGACYSPMSGSGRVTEMLHGGQ